MGLVKMTEEITKIWEDLQGDHPCATATLYVYCDKCGSFSIKSYMGYRRKLLILSICVIIASGILAMFQLKYGIFWLGFCIIICILVFRYLWGDPNYLCRKCGSVPTTDYNTLGYLSDFGILDVPAALAQKCYFDYFPESYNLDDSLNSPETRLIAKDNGFQTMVQDFNNIKDFLLVIILLPLLPFAAIFYILQTELVPKFRAYISSKKSR